MKKGPSVLTWFFFLPLFSTAQQPSLSSQRPKLHPERDSKTCVLEHASSMSKRGWISLETSYIAFLVWGRSVRVKKVFKASLPPNNTHTHTHTHPISFNYLGPLPAKIHTSISRLFQWGSPHHLPWFMT